MKRLILCAVALLVASAGFGQTGEAAAAGGQTTVKNEWLKDFAAVEVNGAFDIELVQVPESEAPKIVYDTKGSSTTKFSFDIKDNVLRIYERVDTRRPERTAVKLYYNRLESLSVSEATATFRETVRGQLFDLMLGARALLHADLEVQDLNMEVDGRNSRAVLTGSARYLTLSVSSGAVDALAMPVVSARVTASSGGSAFVDATERLEATTSTNGRVNYKAKPEILRSVSRLMGGEIGLYTQD